MTTTREPSLGAQLSNTSARRHWLNYALLLGTLASGCTAGGQSGDLNQDALGRNSGDAPTSADSDTDADVDQPTDSEATESSTELETSSDPAATSDDGTNANDGTNADDATSHGGSSTNDSGTSVSSSGDTSSTSDGSPTGVGGSASDVAPDAGMSIAPELTCTVNSDCVAVGANNHCCPHSSFELVVNHASAPPPLALPCAEVACPPERYFATCNAGQCELVDLRDHRLTACDVDEDCVLHSSVCDADCSLDPEPTISLNSAENEDWTSTVCDPETPPLCEGATRSYRVAACVEGSCQMLDQ